MTKKEKATEIEKILEYYYPEVNPPLDHTDKFTLLVAVMLSARCTDIRVNQTTPGLFAKAKTPAEMIQLGQEKIQEIIKPCGLSPAKSKNIVEMSRLLIERHNGNVPGSLGELEALPGVGHKTASVVMSQGFGVPAFPVDTHIHRLAWRWGLSDGRSVEQTEKDLIKLYPPSHWNKLHLQIIFFGREYCPARGHDPKICPVCSKYGRKNLKKS